MWSHSNLLTDKAARRKRLHAAGETYPEDHRLRAKSFTSIGRCNVMAWKSNDLGTVHRDGSARRIRAGISSHSIRGTNASFCDESTAPNRREGRAYWFNDCDYHG